MSPQNQLHTFNDVCNNESLVSDTETYVCFAQLVCERVLGLVVELCLRVCVCVPSLDASEDLVLLPRRLRRSIAKELADWLIHNNVVEHIFGPNLHIEVSPVTQLVLLQVGGRSSV